MANQKPASNRPVASAALSELEVEVIGVFVHLSRLIGLPKSVAEIYGLLFISEQPLSIADLMARLELSKGAASQGLKVLRNFNAVRMVYVAGDRRDHYEAETELRSLMGGFLKEQLKPNLDKGFGRLTRIEHLIDGDAARRRHLTSRLEKLRAWEKGSKELLPFMTNLLGREQ